MADDEPADRIDHRVKPTRRATVADDRQVQGYCPMGCGRTLFLAEGGHVTCSLIGCPNPCAVDDLLDDRETEHLVDFTDAGFSVLHPLRERLEENQGGLWGCDVHRAIEALDGPPIQLGRYRVRRRGAEKLSYERVEVARG